MAGAWLILVPSYTTTAAGFNRVFLSARARAIENQCYVAVAYAVGTVLLNLPAENTLGQCCVLGPADVGFPDDGLIAQNLPSNQTTMLVTDISAEKIASVRRHGATHNFTDSQNFSAKNLEILSLV